MRRFVVLLMLFAACIADASTIEYAVELDQAHAQLITIEVRVPDVTGATLDFALPVWRPGRYVVLDPAGTVQDFHAADAAGTPLPVTKISKSIWRVSTVGAETIAARYTIYANSLRDRTRHVDDTHAFLSGSAVFAYVPDRRLDPVAVTLQMPDGWRIATGLDRDPDDPRRLLARDYDVLVDSPIEVGVHERIDFDVNGHPHAIAIWGEARVDRDELIEDFTKIVRSQAALFGGVPYDRYVFLVHVGPGARGGTEHLNSTIMQTARATFEDPKRYRRFLGLVSHEFFHTWNVKQIRPASLKPYEYLRENYSRLLWIVEGTTSYYDDLTLARTGLLTEKQYLKRLGDSINEYRERPGRSVQTLEASSFDAWITYNQPHPHDVNSTVSFYRKGALVSLLLDLVIRERTDGAKSLDDVMRAMYVRFPLAGPGYTTDDVLTTIDDVTGYDALSFLDAYVRGTVPLPLERALESVGLELTHGKTHDDDDDDADDADDEEPDDADNADATHEPYLGLNVASGERAVVRRIRADGPAFESGVITGDEIIAIDGRRVTGDDFASRVERLEVGETIEIQLFRRDLLRIVEVTTAPRARGRWSIRPTDAPTDRQQRLRDAWLRDPASGAE